MTEEPQEPLVEERIIYEHDGRFFMELTVAELILWRAEAPHLIRVIYDKFCVEIFRAPKQ